MESLVSVLVLVLIVGLIAAVLIWLIDQLPALAPFNWIARAIVVIIAILIIIYKALLPLL